jgi:ESCRT-I complex subunit TSG101
MQKRTPLNPKLDAITRTYENPVKLTEDIANLLARYPALPPKEDVFYANDGTTHTLICLSGTLPILFRGIQYNIPLIIWLVKNYPRAPPFCYVPPTSDMLIKEGHKHVDKNGLCYFPYLSAWDPRKSNLLELAMVMSSAFSAEPPLFTKNSPRPTTPSTFSIVTPPTFYPQQQPQQAQPLVAPPSPSPPQTQKRSKPLPPPPADPVTNTSLTPQLYPTSYNTYNERAPVSYTNVVASNSASFQNEDQMVHFTHVLTPPT